MSQLTQDLARRMERVDRYEPHHERWLLENALDVVSTPANGGAPYCDLLDDDDAGALHAFQNYPDPYETT